jgi:DNA processing protein
VAEFEHRTPLDPNYPSRLRLIHDPPATITLRGAPLEAMHAIAIVGTRKPSDEAIAFTRELAASVVRAGAVVVSGGASGIDEAAHRGAMDAGGRTWVVAATGHERCYPEEHVTLFERIGRGPGTMLWPFAPTYSSRAAFLVRNRLLVALSDAVVVTQAGLPSGALHAASWAKRLGKPLWVVPAAPWMANFDGSRQLLDRGARPLTSPQVLLHAFGLAPGTVPGVPPRPASMAESGRVASLSSHEFAVFQVMSETALHADAIASRAGGSFQATTAALLTLALEDVVVEGPPGFFRRRKSSNP